MSTFKNASLAAAGSIALAYLVQPAAAGTIDVTGVQVPYYELVTITGTVDGSSVSDSNVIAGRVALTAHDEGPPAGADFMLSAWCVDLFHTIEIGTGNNYLYSEGSLSIDNSNSPSALTADQISKIGDLVAYGDDLMQTSPSNLNAALVQAAIWTEEYNNSAIPNNLTVTGAGFSGTDITNTINAAVAHGGQAGQLVALHGAQGLAYGAPAPSIGTGVPSVLAIGVALLGANLASRRKKGRPAETAIPCAAA